MTIQVRFEIYLLTEFYKATEAKDIAHFAQIMEKRCKTTNEYGLAHYDEFQRVFMSCLTFWDSLVGF